MKYDIKTIHNYLELTDKVIKDKELKDILLKYLDSIVEKIKIYVKNEYRFRYAYNMLLIQLENVRCIDLNWDFICKIANYDFKEEINLLNIENHNEKNIRTYVTNAKNLLEGLYIFILENETIDIKDFSILRKNISLFKIGRMNKINRNYNSDIIEKNIKSKYPLGSSVSSIYQTSYIDRRNNEISININLNTTNDFLLSLLKSFIEYQKQFNQDTTSMIEFLYFYYHFEESFGLNNIPNDITEFNVDLFKKQYEYFKSKESLIEHLWTSYPLRRVLIRMYIFIQLKINQMNIEHDIFRDSWINIELLANSSFIEKYDLGYVHIEYNELENYPNNDLWWLSATNEINNSTSSSKGMATSLDFTTFKDDDVKNKVKDYIWNGNGLLKTRTIYLHAFKEFFEHMEEYYSDEVTELYNDEKSKDEISFGLLWSYRIKMEALYPNKSTVMNRMKTMRAFFLFHKNRYNLNQKLLEILTLKREDKEGTPITADDFKILEEEFRAYSQNKKYKNGKLMYYIFILTSTTNLRLGEVLGLERDCIIFKDKNGNGTVRALRKTSSGKYIENEYPAHVIRIIELARDVTETISVDADETYKKYIFITKQREKVSLMNKQFQKVFNKIMSDNEYKLSKWYTPYHLRHTFINVIYDEVSNGSITIDQAQGITGNTYGTVMKNYRRKLEIKDYAEIMCGITISNVNIEGKILEEEKDIANKSIVMNDLGKCVEEDCIGSTLCLACNHFVTTINKIPRFEEEINHLKEKLVDVKNEYSKEEINLELKLLGAYLTNMLSLKNKDSKRGE